jgi:dTMP kinase
MPRGLFVTVEGLDGSGKSTQLRRLKEWLEAEGFAVTATRQPGGTRVGDRIRALLLDTRTESLAPLAELGLMFSDRAQSIAEVIEPALQAGHIVLCDRFTDSSEAYQGGGRQLGSQVVRDLHAALCGGLQPDLTLLLLPDFDLSLARARRRNQRAVASKRRAPLSTAGCSTNIRRLLPVNLCVWSQSIATAPLMKSTSASYK